MKNGSMPRIMYLFAAIAGMMANPLGKEKQLKSARREVHFMQGGGNAEYHPRRKKFKGWQRENRKYHYSK